MGTGSVSGGVQRIMMHVVYFNKLFVLICLFKKIPKIVKGYYDDLSIVAVVLRKKSHLLNCKIIIL